MRLIINRNGGGGSPMSTPLLETEQSPTAATNHHHHHHHRKLVQEVGLMGATSGGILNTETEEEDHPHAPLSSSALLGHPLPSELLMIRDGSPPASSLSPSPHLPASERSSLITDGGGGGDGDRRRKLIQLIDDLNPQTPKHTPPAANSRNPPSSHLISSSSSTTSSTSQSSSSSSHVQSDSSSSRPLSTCCDDRWSWDCRHKSHEVRLFGADHLVAHFHPNWSNGTAGVKGNRPVNAGKGRHYWEIKVSERIFGTSMMFGVATRSARLHADSFLNMLGEDELGWGLSHKGLLWHNGQWRQYCKAFRENESTTIGILLDNAAGTLSYFKDGKCLGVAFDGLDKLTKDLYPMVCSTAAKTEMRLTCMKRDFYNLQDRCRSVIRKRLASDGDVTKLSLPARLRHFLSDEDDPWGRRPPRPEESDSISEELFCNHTHFATRYGPNGPIKNVLLSDLATSFGTGPRTGPINHHQALGSFHHHQPNSFILEF